MRTLSALVLMFALMCPSTMFAQGGRGTILGTVTDATGAAVPNVSVTVVNTGTQQKRTILTDDTGTYQITALDVGLYELNAEAAGFRKASVKQIRLEVDERTRVDVELQIGEVLQEIAVTATTTTVQTDDATISTVISTSEIRELPLPQNRNPFMLALLAPGMSVGPASSVTTSNFGAGFGIAAMGQKVQANQILLDGAPLRTNIHGVTRMRPSVEALQEFRVEAGWYSAEFGTQSGAQIIAAIRPGTNEFHGVLFEFLRNDMFDARNRFARPGQPVAPLRRNTFGGVLSGPIIKNKTFFTFNTEILIERRSAEAVSGVPTARMKAGDLTEPNFRRGATASGVLIPIQDLRAGAPFPNNIIPASRISSVSRNFFDLWPVSNCGPTLYDGSNNLCGSTRNNMDDRQVFGRIDHYLSAKDKLFGRYGFQDVNLPLVPLNPGPPLAGVEQPYGRDNVRRQQNVILQYTRILNPTMINEMKVSYNRDKYGNKDNISGSSLNIYDTFGVPGQTTNPEDVGVPGVGIPGLVGLGTVAPNTIWEQTRQAADIFTWDKGRHTIKVGAELSYFQVDRRTVSFVTGSFNFSGVHSATAPAVLPAETSRLAWADFIQDQPAQVLLGYSPQPGVTPGTYPRMRYHSFNSFVTDDFKITRTLTMNIGLRMEYYSSFYDKNGQTRNFNFQTNELYPAPYTQAPLNDPQTQWAPRIGFAWRPFGGTKTVVRTGYGIFYNFGMVNAWVPNLALNPPNNQNINQTLLPGQVIINMSTADQASQRAVSSAVYATQENAKSYAQQWNLNIQRLFGESIIFEIGYSGSKSTHFDRVHPLNLYVPGTTTRPLPQYGQITYYPYDAAGNYHGLLTKLEKRFSAGITFIQTYTWSKTLFDNWACCGTTWLSNPFNSRAEKGLAEWDIRHRSTTAWLYELPFYRGNRSFVGQVLGGWQVNGTMVIATGMPLYISNGVVPVQDGCNQCGYRPDLLGDPKLSDPTVERWFDTSAFAVARGHYGNAGRNIVTNPGRFNIDFSVFKNFPITETKSLQFRWESYNFTNTPPLGMPGSTAGTATFGQITSADQSREMQFGLRFQF